jgi:hypothetical protein
MPAAPVPTAPAAARLAPAESVAAAPTYPRPVPAPRSRPVPRSWPAGRVGTPAVAAGAVVLLAIVVLGVGAYLFLPSATITVTPRQEAIGPISLVVRADAAATEADSTPGHEVVPAVRVEVPVEVTESFTTTGKKVTETKASGTVTFQSYNFLSTNTIPAGSVVSTEGGIQFVTRRAVTLAKADFVLPNVIPSRADVAVDAAQAGTAGNVPANAVRVVPKGEDPELTKVRNAEPTAGGSHNESPEVTAKEVEAALASLRPKLTNAFTAAIESGAGAPEDTTPFPETAVLGEPTPTLDPATLVGQAVETFELGLTATGTMIAVNAAPVAEIAETRLLSNIGEGYRLVEGSQSVIPGDPTIANGEVSFPVTARAARIKILDPRELLLRVKGQSVERARGILAEFGEPTISTWPDWVSTIPGIDSRVTLTIDDPGATESPEPGAGASPTPSSRAPSASPALASPASASPASAGPASASPAGSGP